MFGSLGFQEIAVILILALLIFGPRKLPEIGRSLGRSLGEFRRATNDLKRSIEQEVRAEEIASSLDKAADADPARDARAPEVKTSEVETSEVKTPEVKAPEVKAPEANAPHAEA